MRRWPAPPLALRHRLEVLQELPLRHRAIEGMIDRSVGHLAVGRVWLPLRLEFGSYRQAELLN